VVGEVEESVGLGVETVAVGVMVGAVGAELEETVGLGVETVAVGAMVGETVGLSGAAV